MNKETYEKMSTYEQIDYDIQMELYVKYNDEIARINDNLGIIYGYNDLKDAEDLEKQEELVLYKKSLKEKCDTIDKAIDKLYCWGEALQPKFQKEMLDILKKEQ